MSTVKLLVDECWGVRIPSRFCELYANDAWNIKELESQELSDTENPLYWETWESVRTNACFVDEQGYKWSLYQEGSLFAVREDHDWDLGDF
jgi:hypothetical protein